MLVESAPTRQTSTVAGSLIDTQPATGGTVLWNAMHSVDVPISRARLRLTKGFLCHFNRHVSAVPLNRVRTK